MTPAFTELLIEMRERLYQDVAARDAQWSRYWREKARWTSTAPTQTAKAVPILERAARAANLGAALVMIRQAIGVLSAPSDRRKDHEVS